MNKDIKKVMLISGGISAEREISLISGKEVAKSLDRLGHKIIHVDANLNLLEKIEESKPDVIFNALHGTWGEDGQVQKILELSKTAYTHSGVKASQIAMDKHESAKIFIKNDIKGFDNILLIYTNTIKIFIYFYDNTLINNQSVKGIKFRIQVGLYYDVSIYYYY